MKDDEWTQEDEDTLEELMFRLEEERK